VHTTLSASAEQAQISPLAACLLLAEQWPLLHYSRSTQKYAKALTKLVIVQFSLGLYARKYMQYCKSQVYEIHACYAYSTISQNDS